MNPIDLWIGDDLKVRLPNPIDDELNAVKVNVDLVDMLTFAEWEERLGSLRFIVEEKTTSGLKRAKVTLNDG